MRTEPDRAPENRLDVAYEAFKKAYVDLTRITEEMKAALAELDTGESIHP